MTFTLIRERLGLVGADAAARQANQDFRCGDSEAVPQTRLLVPERVCWSKL